MDVGSSGSVGLDEEGLEEEGLEEEGLEEDVLEEAFEEELEEVLEDDWEEEGLGSAGLVDGLEDAEVEAARGSADHLYARSGPVSRACLRASSRSSLSYFERSRRL